MPAHKVGAVGRKKGSSEIHMFFDTLAALVRCDMVTDNTDGEENPTVTEIRLDELLNQYADEINRNTAAIQQLQAEVSGVSSGFVLGSAYLGSDFLR